MTIATIVLFSVLGLVVVGSALGMLLSRNAVYAALFLVLNFATVALLYLILGAPFIAVAQVSVYAGAIMVLFLFVIMLLGAEKMPTAESLKRHRPLAILLGLVLLGEVVLYLVLRGGSFNPMPPVSEGFGSPAQIGLAMYTQYALPFEITSIILLAALVGAIILTRQDPTRAQRKEG